MSLTTTTYSPRIWNYLNGVICVFKPAGLSAIAVRHRIITNICKELNELKCRPPRPYLRIVPNEDNKYDVVKDVSYADHPLVIGPRYQLDDVRCAWANYLGTHISGVFLMGLNDGAKIATKMRTSQVVRAYKIRGRLGVSTDTFFRDGNVIEKSTYKFIKKHHMERVLSSMEAAHQKKIAELCGLDIQTQEAYDIISQGLTRPKNSEIPVIFNIKCTEFESPYFTIEVQAVNEYQVYLMALISEIATKLHSTAVCESIQCIRDGYFTVENALLRKHWWLQPIVNNLRFCSKVLQENKHILIEQKAAVLSS